MVLWVWNLDMAWLGDSSVPRHVSGGSLLVFHGGLGQSGRSETASVTCLAPCSDGWKAGRSWDWRQENLHVASPAWWPQDSQISYVAAQGPRVTDLANNMYVAWAFMTQPEVTLCDFCHSLLVEVIMNL